jgi:hypothetical protein
MKKKAYLAVTASNGGQHPLTLKQERNQIVSCVDAVRKDDRRRRMVVGCTLEGKSDFGGGQLEAFSAAQVGDRGATAEPKIDEKALYVISARLCRTC